VRGGETATTSPGFRVGSEEFKHRFFFEEEAERFSEISGRPGASLDGGAILRRAASS
jgi:hypothetical protein